MIQIRKINLEDCSSIAEIHMICYPTFFLTYLGKGFLTMYYKSLVKSKETIILCASDENNKIVGFVSGTLLCKGFNKRLIMKNKFAFLKQTLKILLTKPKSLYHILTNMEKKSNLIDDDGLYAELLTLGVIPSYTKRGIGENLLKASEEEIKKHNIDTVTLTTDYYDNDGVLRLYKRIGWDEFYDFHTYPNRRMYKMIKKIK